MILKLKKGFTLAEVLITLGILGIVAAITLPLFVQNYKKHETSSKLKKFYSTIEQSTLMATQEHGDVTNWENTRYITAEEMDNFVKKYFLPYLKYYKYYNKTIYFYDDSTVRFDRGSSLTLTFDYNGSKKPNQITRDQFYFLFSKENKPITGWVVYNTREAAKEACACSAFHCPYKCVDLLMKDNFEFKDDYPYKL